MDEDSSAPDSAFYEEEFDGISAETGGGALRDTSAVEQQVSAGFGIPLDIGDISARASDEFEASMDKTRAISTLDQFPCSAQPGALDPSSTEFEAGSAFRPCPGLFAGAVLPPPHVHEEVHEAPPLPHFVKPARTSFRCTQPLTALRAALESAFAATSVTFCPADEALASEGDPHPCAYACSSVCLLSVVTFEVRVFALPASPAPKAASPRHLVEVRHLSGCRYAFKTAAAGLDQRLGAAFKAGAGCCSHPVTRPPELSQEDFLGLPSLQGYTSSYNREAAVKKGVEEREGGKKEEDERAEDGEEEADTCEHLMKLLADDAPLSSQVQGARATGALAADLAAAMDSCELHGACGVDHGCCRATLFAQGGAWAPLADRVMALAAPGGGEGRDEALRTAAMAAVANVAALRTACGKWLEAAVAAVAEGAGDDSGHVRREALRAAATLAERDEGAYAAKLVRAGAVPALELEASGGDEESCPDDAARRFAEAALLACRS